MTTYRFRAAADCYEPMPRVYLYGTLNTGMGFEGRSDVIVFESGFPADAYKATYILDFGDRVEVRFLAGWQPKTGELFVQPFPLNAKHWMLGPRRAFHLKLTEVTQ